MTTLLRLDAVMSRTKLGRSTLYKLVNSDRFPKPTKIGDRVLAWRDSDIEEWINAQFADD